MKDETRQIAKKLKLNTHFITVNTINKSSYSNVGIFSDSLNMFLKLLMRKHAREMMLQGHTCFSKILSYELCASVYCAC